MIPEDHKVNVSLFPVGLQQQLWNLCAFSSIMSWKLVNYIP
jgi:hypothetical protein